MQKFIFIVKFISLVFISSISSSSNLSAQNYEKDCKVLPRLKLDYDIINCRRVIVNASFPGGTSAWMKYITDNVKYPQKDTQTEPQICVKLRFVILKTGAIEYAETINDLKNEFTKKQSA